MKLSEIQKKIKELKRRNPVARMMQSREGSRLFRRRVERAKKGRGSYTRTIKHKTP